MRPTPSRFAARQAGRFTDWHQQPASSRPATAAPGSTPRVNRASRERAHSVREEGSSKVNSEEGSRGNTVFPSRLLLCVMLYYCVFYAGCCAVCSAGCVSFIYSCVGCRLFWCRNRSRIGEARAMWAAHRGFTDQRQAAEQPVRQSSNGNSSISAPRV